METTKKISETPLVEQMVEGQTIVIVDEEGNVARVKKPEVESIPDEYIGGLE